MLRWLLMAGASFSVAVLAVLGGLSVLRNQTQVSVPGAIVGWVVLGLAGFLLTGMVRRVRGRGRRS
ncbi:hypothetical protein [Actinacidiphila soli]|jgi:hypothetical protein|uniref:hypothetical protein n=1 Tax=Actinacidiphila soli TaxID=2487275 RepID=UPI000FCB9650|nr:hypothetical protein [Actinacidiphila soli]